MWQMAGEMGGQMGGASFCRNLAITRALGLYLFANPFQGLPLDDALARKAATPRCGLGVIDLRSGDLVHSLRIEGVVEELYDVQVLPGFRRPMAIGFRSDEIRRIISIGDPASLQ